MITFFKPTFHDNDTDNIISRVRSLCGTVKRNLRNALQNSGSFGFTKIRSVYSL